MFTADDRVVCPHYAGFFNTNLFPGIAKPNCMIQTYRRNQRNIGVKQIHRIKPSAHTNFQNRDINILSTEDICCSERGKFEIAQRNVTTCGINPLESFTYLLISRRLTIN